MKVLGLNIHFNCLYCILNYLLNIFKNIFFRTFLIVFFSYNANCQFIQQSNKLVELDGKSSNYFGASVSISGDGKTAIIGARNANSFNGCAYIYSKIGNNWIQKAKLFSDMHEGAAKQGYSVSISFDGNTVAYGGPDDNLGNGAVWIFIKLDGIWTQQGPKIVGNESIGSGFGTSISISNDGNSFVTGGPSSELGIGAVWVYNRVSGIWTPDGGKIVGTGSAAGGATNQGISVAMSGNARTIIFGGYKDSAGIGGAWIFVKNGNVWTPQSEKIIPNDYVGTPYFGSSVTISTDGSTAAVGGYKDATDIGAIWIYSIVNGTWVQQGPKLTASDITGAGNLGSSCSLSSDGRTLLASGGKDNTNSGAVWLFKKNTVWEQIGTKILGSNKTGSSSFQGGSIDISSNGSTLICGGYGDNLEAGAAWFFQEMPKLFLNGPTSPVAITTDKTSTLLFSISHGGVSNSQEGYLHYFISKDFIYDSLDQKLSDLEYIPSMPSGGSTTQELIFSLSANYSGLYYILAILDPNNISYQYNSTNLFGSIPLNVGQSDLSIKFRSITPASTYAGEQIEINSTLANASAISTGSKSVVQYYLSKNSILDSSDLGIGSFSVSAILPNETLVAPKLSYTIPPATPAGKYYIMIFADKTRAIPESNENNNVDSILFTVNPAPITDLSIKFTKATPTSVMPGDVVLLDCLIINSGSTSIGRSSLGYHISYNNIIFDALDPAITFPVGIPIVEPGIVIEAAQISYKVPNNAAAGTYTIFFVADSDKEYLESNEENNIGSASFNVGSLPELLAVPPVLSNSNLLPGQSTKINFTVKNNGAGDAGSFQIKYFFSSNDIYESTDLEILPSQNVAAVTGGKSFVANEVSFTIPTSTTAGTYYIFAMADFGATVKESNEADNMSSATFKVGAFADMKANPLILDKTKVLPLETISISGSLSNAGGSTAINFDVQYYISTESIFNAATATPLFSAVLVPPLSAEELYTLPIQKYIIPSGSKEGIYYLFAILDKSATIAESNESNNVAVASFTIASLADLKVITPFASATALLPGESSEISFEVFNNGTSASLSCTLSFFLSTSPEYKTGDTPVLAPVVIPDLMPGESFAITPQSYKMPTPASAGAYYIVAVVDIKNEVIESIESNNSNFVVLKVGAFSDLFATTISSNFNSILSGDSITLSGRVINFGSNAIAAYNIQYFLSPDDEYNTSDISLSIPLRQNSLGVNGVNNLLKTKYKIPLGTLPGNYFLLLVADKEAAIKELDITNNVISTPLTIIGLPDFVISTPIVRPLSVFTGDSLTISCNLENKGGNTKNSIVDVYYFLSTNDKYEDGDTPLSSTILQKSPQNLSSVSIAAQKFQIPSNILSGAYYVIMVADLKKEEIELSEVNNNTSVAVTVAALPDLSIESAVVTGDIVLPGDSIRVAVTLANGGSAIGTAVNLAYYFSLDTKVDSSDKMVANITVPPLAGLTSAKLPIVSYKIPLLTAPSNYYILIAADSKNIIREAIETNNLGHASVAVSSTSLADYSIDAPSLSASFSISGDTILLGCTVKNSGYIKASKESFAQYFLSTDKVWDKNDVILSEAFLLPMLDTGGSQIVPAKKCIVPASTKTGNYYVLYFADKDNALFEANETNNITAMQLKISERADLTITAEYVNPQMLYQSDSVGISCTVENKGNGKMPLSINLQYFLSTDKFYDKDDKSIGNGLSIPILDGGGKFEVALSRYKLPNVAIGNYFILLVIDNTNDVIESNEANNIIAAGISLEASADLRIKSAIANPNKVFPGDATTITATIQNVGKGKTENSFRVQFFLSKNKTFELSDESISEPVAFVPIFPLDNKTYSFPYTIKTNQAIGTYFVLVVVDAGNQVRESDESNNILSIPLQIGKIELMDIRAMVPINKSLINTLLAGDSINFEENFKNIGTEPTRVCNLQFFLSIDEEVSNSDLALITPLEIPVLDTSKFFPFKKYIRIPLTVKPGQYYLLSFADMANVLNETNEENNIYPYRIEILPFPDLQVTQLKASRETIFIGDTTTLSSTVINASGSKTSKSVTFQYFLSSDRQYSKEDRPIGNEFSVPILDTAEVHNIPAAKLILPSDLTGGFYYLLPVIDSKHVLRESNEGNNTLPKRFTINPRPVIVPPDTLVSNPGSNDLITINIKVKSELPVAKVNFTYRKLTNFQDTVSINLPLKGLSFSGKIPKSFLDEIGAEYAFYAIDSSGNKSLLSQGSVPREWPSPGLKIPYYTYGPKVENYRMIAIPLNLKNKHIDVIMQKSQGVYDKKRWRMYNYRDGATVEYTFGLDTIDAGKGYWFIAKDSSAEGMYTGAGTTVTASIENPYSIQLVSGWNQIGNPYNMNIYWSDLIKYNKNNKDVLDAFYTYNGSYKNERQNDRLASMEGAFIYAKENTRLYFPTQKRKQNSNSLRKGVSMDNQNWTIDFKLSDEMQTSNISGLGMSTTAIISKDEHDALTPPKFLNYLELNFAHPEYTYSKFTRDIIPTMESYVWDFTIESEIAGKKTLSWNSDYFKSNAKKLVLYDREVERVINMGTDSIYSFESGSVKQLSVYYGNPEFIEEKIQPERITLGNPYPNPLTEKTTFAVSLPAGLNIYAVKLSVCNAFGQEVHTIVNTHFAPGFYNFTWDGLDEQGNKKASGIYLIKLKVDAAGLERELSRKVIVK